jgi:hypothetical protein
MSAKPRPLPLNRSSANHTEYRGGNEDLGYRAALRKFLIEIPIMPRQVLERLVEHLIAHLDRCNGDPDLEDEGLDWEHDGREPDDQW